MLKYQGPTLDLDNSPASLLHIAARRVVLDQIDFSHVSLPQELYNLLIQVYREEHASRSKVADCGQFLSQLCGAHRLSQLHITGLPVTDSDLEELLYRHSRHISSLDISDCPKLTHRVLQMWTESLTNLTDMSKICRTISLERTHLMAQTSELLSLKIFPSGELRWGIVDTSISDNGETPDIVSTDDIDELFEQASLHENNIFHRFYVEYMASKNLEENLLDTSQSFDVDDKVDCGNGIVISFKRAQRWEVTQGDYCYTLDIQSWQTPALNSLTLGDFRQLLVPDVDKKSLYVQFFSPYCNLKKIVIHHWPFNIEESSLSRSPAMSHHLTSNLEYLDLSRCKSIGFGRFLLNLKKLKVLILYDVPKLKYALKSIAQLSTLRYLDISASNDQDGHEYKHPEEELTGLSTGLPHLTHLDISGTNLAGARCEYIRGLANRFDTPFQFLGLYLTSNEAAYRPNIPALRVAGDATDEQILTACEQYIDRADVLKKSLNDLFQCFRVENNFKDFNRALNIVLVAMRRHLRERQIQITATASLFYIVKLEHTSAPFNSKVRRTIIKTLLDAMHEHRDDITMLRNASLTLVYFKIPQDVLFEYTRLVDILLFIVTKEEDQFVQRLGVYLLNTLACQVDGEQKRLVGDLGAISKMLALIVTRLERRLCDEVMETAWSTMWNVTDETPLNCERFLDNRGMDYFMECVKSFPSKPELLRNMMGLLGNVAECANLRQKLMKKEYIDCFTKMLFSQSDGIEISYNAAGILAHIVSDGDEVWHEYLPHVDRDDVLKQLRTAISSWKINSDRNINYRSFEPILRLLSPAVMSHEAQYWAIFALVNLTRVNSEKYCDLFVSDGGVEIVHKLLERPDLPSCIVNYAHLTLHQVERYRKFGGLGSLKESDSIELPDLIEME